MAPRTPGQRSVFINCPFSPDYRLFFEAILFVIVRSGFDPRCGLENDDGGENRFDKICKIIAECRYGVHDISKTELDETNQLPRFNMPLELGLFLGARKFGGSKHANKKTIIFDRQPHRFQAFISDIAGQDIHSHDGAVDRLMEHLAAWLRREVRDSDVPGGRAIAEEFARFQSELGAIAATKRLHRDELTFADLAVIMPAWIIAANV